MKKNSWILVFPIVMATVVMVACAAETPDSPAETGASAVDSTPVVLDNPAPAGAGQPNLAVGAEGQVHLSWLERLDDRRALRVATLEVARGTWTPTETVAEHEGMFANWADFPSVVELANGDRVAHWLQYLADGRYSYGVQLSRTGAGGAWGAPWQPHDDSSPTEHGFVSLVPDADGGFSAIWLDGRAFADESTPAEMSVRARHYDAAGEPGTEEVLDLRVCDCCQTGAAMLGDALVVVYRDRTAEEIRDISSVRRTSNGWSEPISVADDGWMIPGCPVNGPLLVSTGGTSGAVGWFGMVEDRPEVKLAFTTDAGASFEAPILLERGTETEATLGRVGVASLGDGTVVVTWLTQVGERAEIRYQHVGQSGTLGPAHVLAETGPARASGFARVVRSDDNLVFAWTDTLTEPAQLRTARLPVALTGSN